MIDPHDDRIIRPREFILGLAFVVLVVGFTAVVLAMHGFSSEGDSSGLPTPSPSPSPVPSDTPVATTAGSPGESVAPSESPGITTGGEFSPGNATDDRLLQLARDSVEFLPAGRWPELYDEFTQDFRDRCSREDFIAAGEQGAAAQGSNLSLIAFVRLDDVVINGESATGIIVGALQGQSEYKVSVSYRVEDGVWKLAPATGTSGCSAFNRLAN